MSNSRDALVLHFTGGREPMPIAVAAEDMAELSERIPELMRLGVVEDITAANGMTITVHFGHVVAAHQETYPSLGTVYGAATRTAAGYGGHRSEPSS